MVNRIKRVAPLYYAVTLFVFALAVVAPLAFQSTTTSFAALLKSLAFIPFEKTPGRIYPIYYLGWTLNYEMFFYVVFAICLQLHYKTRVYTCIAVIAACVLLRELLGESSIVPLYWYSQPIMLDFVLGMILALNRDRIASTAKSFPAFLWLTLTAGIVGLLIAASSVFQDPAGAYDPPTKTFFLFGIPAMFIVASGIASEGKWRCKATCGGPSRRSEMRAIRSI
ncbi:MAG: acyltransferase [Alcaligenaceae bacterium]|nr:MAG: acyltransferase [Alcaligenaceae bacterium]